MIPDPRIFNYLLGLKSTPSPVDPARAVREWSSLSSGVSRLATDDLTNPDSDESFTVSPEQFEKVSKALATLGPENRLQTVPGLSDDAVVFSAQALDRLRGLLPPSKSPSLFGVRDIPPTRYDQSKFWRAVEILRDPGVLLSWARSGDLQYSDMDNFSAFYPEQYEAIKGSLAAGLALKANGTEPGLRNQKALSTFLLIPRLTPTLLKTFQESFASAPRSRNGEEQKPKSTDLRGAGASKVPESLTTTGQKLSQA